MRVSVFGGSLTKPGQMDYDRGVILGRMLAEAGYTVLTGGYMGMMEAVSKGAGQGGGHVIGVTCDEIETWRPTKPNKYIHQELRFRTLRERMFHLIEECDAAIAMPGGAGTLAELVSMWDHMRTKVIPQRPLILVGEGWQKTFSAFYENQNQYIPAEYRALLLFAQDAAAAIAFLQDALGA